MPPSDAPRRRPRPAPAPPRPRPRAAAPEPADVRVVDTGPLGFWVDERCTPWTRLLDRRDAAVERLRARLTGRTDDPGDGRPAAGRRAARRGGMTAIGCGVALFAAGTLVTPLAGADVARHAHHAPRPAVTAPAAHR